MKKQLEIFILLILLSAATVLSAQSVWPIRINGNMTGPRSLDLSVYSNERQNDLFFNATLIDASRPNLDVTFSLSIESDGGVIYRTDPNFFAPLTNLVSGVPKLLNGGALRPYLSPEALTGVDPASMGSLEVPPGNVQICLQAIGVNRRIPLSQKFCIDKNFQLNQPPQLIMPSCGEQMELKETQNILFNWNEMNLGTQNSPRPVEYRFELVELPPGTTNANDAFNSALKIYQTTTMAARLLYTQAEPQLEPNKIYAWRVKEYSMMHPTSILFQNEGYSPICSFLFYEDDPVVGGEVLGGTGGVVPDKAPPQNCQTFNTDYGPVTGNRSENTPLTEEDIVKVGYFDMELTQLIPGASGYSGTGKITVPMFNCQVNVNFKGIRVNSNYRVFEAEEIIAKTEREFILTPNEIIPSAIGDNISNRYITDLQNFFNSGRGVSRKVSGLNLANPSALNLPLALDAKEPLIAVVGINFTPRNAYLNLVTWSNQGGSEPMRFAATGVQATPFGMKSTAHLVPIGGGTGTSVISGAFGLSYSQDGNSKITCDCEGFRELNLTPEIVVSKDLMERKGSDKPLKLSPITSNETPETYIGDIRNLQEFTINSLPDFSFKTGAAKLDLNTSEALQLSSPLPGYNALTKGDWRGLVLENVEVVMPKEYDFTGNGNKVTIPGGSLVLNETQVDYGNFTQTDVLDISQGKMGTWAYSVDSLYVKMANGTTTGATLVGNIQVPVFTDLFKYRGVLAGNATGQITMNVDVPSENLDMAMWRGQLVPDAEKSSVTAKLTDDGSDTRSFFPSANFTGDFSMAFSDAQITGALAGDATLNTQKISDMKSGFGINGLDFDLKNVNFKGFELQPFASAAEKFKMEYTDFSAATATIGGTSVNVNNVQLVNAVETGRLGLTVLFTKDNNTAEMTFWSKPSTSGFEFDNIDLKVIKVQCQCLSALEPLDEGRWGAVLDDVIENHYGHLFNDNVSSGSLTAYDVFEKTAGWQSILDKNLRQKLRGNTLGGFPVLDGTADIVIGFLDSKRLSLDENNKGVVAPEFTNRENYTFSNLDAKAADKSLENMLPFDVTNQLNYLGVTGRGIPSGARLLITAFDVTNSVGAEWQQSTIELMLVYQLSESKHLRFSRIGIPVTTASIDFKGLFLDLENELPLDNNLKFIKGDGTNNGDSGSYVVLGCEKGFEKFNVQATYELPFGENSTKLKAIGSDNTFSAAKFELTLDTPTSLTNFSAPLKATTNGVPWKITAEGNEQLIFSPGENFEAVLDYDSKSSVSGAPNAGNANSSEFKGIVFKTLKTEIAGIKNENNQALSFDVENLVFKKEVGLVSNKITEINPQLRNDNATLDGWKYEIEKVSFEFENGSLKPEKWSGSSYESGGLQLKGSLKVPAFKDLDDKPELQGLGYSSGWLAFDGTVSNDQGTPKATLKAITQPTDKFLFDFIPGLSMVPGSEGNISTITWSFNQNKKELSPAVELNGNAEIIINEELLNAYGSDLDPEATGMKGINLDVKNLKVEKFKITDANLANLDIGTWGTITASSEAPAAEGMRFQGFPGSMEAPVFKQVAPGKVALSLPSTLNLVADTDNGSGTTTSGLNSRGSVDFIMNQVPTGMSFAKAELKDFTIEGQFGPAAVSGKLTIARDGGSSSTGGFQTTVNTEIEGKAVTAPIVLGTSAADPEQRYFQIALNTPEIEADPILIGNRRVHSISGGLTPAVNEEINPGVEVEGTDTARFFNILTFTPPPAPSYAPTGADPADLETGNLFKNPGFNGSSCFAEWQKETVDVICNAGEGFAWLNHSNRAGDPAVKQTVTGLIPGANYKITVGWRGGDHGPSHGMRGAKNIFSVDLDGKEIKRLTTESNYTAWKVNDEAISAQNIPSIMFKATKSSHEIRFRGEVGADGDVLLGWVKLEKAVPGGMITGTPPGADKTAPEAPVGITAEVDASGNVTINWDASSSTDVAGYWLYWSNDENEEMSQLNSQRVSGTSYTYPIDPVSLNRYIYYSVRAEDGAFNRSTATPAIQMARPDNVAPLAPFVTEVTAESDGMRIKWAPSNSNDVATQILYKKILSQDGPDNGWLEVTRLDADAKSYKDFFAAIDLEAQYRLQAEDEAGNQSGFSNYKSARIGFPTGEAIVSNFRILKQNKRIAKDKTLLINAAKEDSRKIKSETARLNKDLNKLNAYKAQIANTRQFSKKEQSAARKAKAVVDKLRREQQALRVALSKLKLRYNQLRKRGSKKARRNGKNSARKIAVLNKKMNAARAKAAQLQKQKKDSELRSLKAKKGAYAAKAGLAASKKNLIAAQRRISLSKAQINKIKMQFATASESDKIALQTSLKEAKIRLKTAQQEFTKSKAKEDGMNKLFAQKSKEYQEAKNTYTVANIQFYKMSRQIKLLAKQLYVLKNMQGKTSRAEQQRYQRELATLKVKKRTLESKERAIRKKIKKANSLAKRANKAFKRANRSRFKLQKRINRSQKTIANREMKIADLRNKLAFQKANLSKTEYQDLSIPRLMWQYNPRNSELATGSYVFEIFRSTGNSPVELIKTINGGIRSFSDENVEANVLYNYGVRVRYVNGWLGADGNQKSFRVLVKK